jgi:hypothetical protein
VWGCLRGRATHVSTRTHARTLTQVTSGLGDSVDYYASLDDAEPRTSAGDHYDEQLVRIRGAHSAFWGPPADAPPLPLRTAAGARGAAHLLSAATSAAELLGGPRGEAAWSRERGVALCGGNATVYLCPQVPSKLHPVMDRVFIELLEADTCGILLVLFDTAYATRLARRLAAAAAATTAAVQIDASEGRAGGGVLERIALHATVDMATFFSFLRSADVLVDTYPFGGCTTSYEALLLGTPVATAPSPYLRGRFSLALLRRVGLVHGIAAGLATLPTAAVRLGREMAAARRAGNDTPRLLLAHATRAMNEDPAPIHDWVAFLTRAIGAAWREVADFGEACSTRGDPVCT